MSTSITILLDDEIKARLDRLAKWTKRSKASLVSKAIREFLESNESQIAGTRTALEEADAGDFATEEEVAALAQKWEAGLH